MRVQVCEQRLILPTAKKPLITGALDLGLVGDGGAEAVNFADAVPGFEYPDVPLRPSVQHIVPLPPSIHDAGDDKPRSPKQNFRR